MISFVLGTLLGIAGGLAAGQLAGQPAAGHHVLPGRAVLLPRDPAVALFATKLRLVPGQSGLRHRDPEPGLHLAFITNVLDHAVLPALTIVLASAAGWILGMRNVMVTTMDEDYVLLAAGQGPAQSAG